MDKGFGLIVIVALLLCPKGNTGSQTFCPYKCHCFTSAQVLCADGGLSYLPRNMSRQVKDFILISSDLQYLFSHTLRDSPQLTKLVFLNNALRSIHAQAFEHLVELQELEVSGSPWLDSLFLGTFANQENLTKLTLNNNGLKTVLPGMFDSLIQLETLQMKGNVISDLPSILFMNLQNLRVLDLSRNKIKTVTFSGLARLEILKMNHNLISELTSDMFHNISGLTELHLEGNKIAELAEGIFFVFTELQVLNLRGNLLTTFSDKVFGFEASNLTELNLKGNRLTELSSLGSFTSLSDLNLSSNQLSSLTEDVFRNVTALEYLDLSENQLTSLPEMVFNSLFNIKTIHLNKNSLSKVDAKLFEDQVLIQQLYLDDNQMETMPWGLLDSFAIQHTVRLHGNPWKCDCHLWYLHDWVQRNSQDIEMLDRVLCQNPGFLRRRPVASVDREQLVCRLTQDEVPDFSRCSQEAFKDTVVIKCKVDKCSPLTVKVQLQGNDGSFKEHTFNIEPEYSQCSNETTIDSPIH